MANKAGYRAKKKVRRKFKLQDQILKGTSDKPRKETWRPIMITDRPHLFPDYGVNIRSPDPRPVVIQGSLPVVRQRDPLNLSPFMLNVGEVD